MTAHPHDGFLDAADHGRRSSRVKAVRPRLRLRALRLDPLLPPADTASDEEAPEERHQHSTRAGTYIFNEPHHRCFATPRSPTGAVPANGRALILGAIVTERVAFLGPLVKENPDLATAQFVNDGSVIAAVNPGRRDTYRAMREERGRPCSCGHPAVRLEPRGVLADAAASTVTMRRLAFLGR